MTAHMLPGNVIAVPARVAAQLIQLPGFKALRVQAYGTPDYPALHALYVVGLSQSVPPNGTNAALGSAAVPSWITTGQAAEILRITKRAVTKQLTTGQLAGRKSGGTWQVDRHSLEERIHGRRTT